MTTTKQGVEGELGFVNVLAPRVSYDPHFRSMLRRQGMAPGVRAAASDQSPLYVHDVL